MGITESSSDTLVQQYRYLVSAFLKAYESGPQWEIHERLARLRELNEEVIDGRWPIVDD